MNLRDVTQKLNVPAVLVANTRTWTWWAIVGAPLSEVPELSQHLVLNIAQGMLPDVAVIGAQ